jgi:hypothetical protein
MKITLGTIEHIKQLAISREDNRLSEEDTVELFDSIDCLDPDELSELYAIIRVGQSQVVEQFDAAVVDARGRGVDVSEHIFGLRELGTLLAAGTAQLKLG